MAEDDDEADLFPLLLLPEEAGPEISWTDTTPHTFFCFFVFELFEQHCGHHIVGDEDKIGRTPEIVRTTVSLFSVGPGQAEPRLASVFMGQQGVYPYQDFLRR